MARKRAPAKDRYHHGNLRQVLLQGGLQALKEMGPQDISLRDVARRAGVSHTAPYAHFKNKQELLAALACQGFADLDQAMEDAQRAAPPDPKPQWLATGVAYALFGLHNPAVFRLMWQRDALEADFAREPGNATGKPFERLLDALARVPGVAPRDSAAFMRDALLSWAAVHGLVALALDGAIGREGVHPAELTRDVLSRLVDLYPSS